MSFTPCLQGTAVTSGKPVSLLHLLGEETHCSGTRRGRRKGRAASKQTLLDCAATLYIINGEGNGIENTL